MLASATARLARSILGSFPLSGVVKDCPATLRCPLALAKRRAIACRLSLLVGLGGLEPPTSRLSGVRSNRLSYKPIIPDSVLIPSPYLSLSGAFTDKVPLVFPLRGKPVETS